MEDEYIIELSEEELEGVSLNSDSADDIAEKLELVEYMDNFIIDEVDYDNNGSHLVLIGQIKGSAINEYDSVNGVLLEIKKLETVESITKKIV